MLLPRHDPISMRREIDDERRYLVDAVGPYPLVSVTSVIAGAPTRSEDWAIRTWAASMNALEPGFADVARDVAADRGTRLHEQVTTCLVERRAPGPDADVWLRSCAKTIAQWRVLARLALADGVVWHGYDMVAGTVDFVLEIAGRLWVFDLKSATKPRAPDQLRRGVAQLGGYAELLEWTYPGITIAGAGLLVALPDREAQVRMVGVDEAKREWSERLARFRLRE